MIYTELPEIVRGILLALTTLVLIMYIYSIIRMLDIGRKDSYLIITIFEFIVAFIMYQGMIMYQQEDIGSFDITVEAIVPALLVLIGYVVYIQYNLFKWQRENISVMSVKEAFDKLPSGLVFYTGKGIPVMVNETMHKISRELYGEPLMDVDAFWRRLSDDKEKDNTPDPDNAIVRTPNGRIYSIRRNTIDLDKGVIWELTAIDISREYELTRELEDKRDKARVLNGRLKALMGTIEYVTMNRELLQLKAALHDNIGQSILIARRYLYSPLSVDKERMIDFWKDNISHLVNDTPEEWELPYYVIAREADRLGIKLEIIGDLPDEPELIPIVDSAISVHIGNTLKHTEGSEVSVSVSRTEEDYIINLTNDGRRPEGAIEERGGLANLRREVEGIGGRMEVLVSPDYILRIILPRQTG